MAFSLILIWLLVGHKTGTHWDASLPVTAKGLAAHILLIQDIYSSAQINHVFWSIAVEWQIYFVFPLLVLLWRRVGGLATTSGTVLLSLVGLHFLNHTVLAGVTPQYLGLFALGMLGAVIAYSTEDRWVLWRERMPWNVFMVVMAAIACLLCHMRKEWHADYFVGLTTICLLVSIARPGTNGMRTLLSARPLAFVGTFAYSIYLIHAPLLQVVWQYALHPLHLGAIVTFALLACVGGPLIVGGSYLFFLACERPFLTGRKPAP